MGSSSGTMPSQNTKIIQKCTCLTRVQQLALIHEITNEKIDQPTNDMPIEKAPGMDGFPMEFFKRNWNIVKQDLYATIWEFFATSVMNYLELHSHKPCT